MKFWAKVARVFAYIFGAVAAVIVVGSLVGVARETGFSGIFASLSPFNVLNWIVTVILFTPCIALLALSDWLAKR